jgi:hypothetical protein
MKNTYQQFYTAFEKCERINTHWFYNLDWNFDEIIFNLNKICEMSNATENSLEVQLLLTLEDMKKSFIKFTQPLKNVIHLIFTVFMK